METTFYDDNNLSVKKMKTNMTLDFNKMKQTSDLLQTPDMGGLLMMNTPELERLLACNNFNTVMTTPTPTGQILFPKMVTEEQEAYARGFIDALGELHKKSQVESLPSSTTQTPLRPQTQQHLQPATVQDVKVVLQQQQQQPQAVKTKVIEQQLRATPPSTSAAVTSATSTSAPYLPTTITDMIGYNNFADFNISEMNNIHLIQNNPLLQPLKPLMNVNTTTTTNNINTNSKVYFNASASPPQLIENYQTVPHLPTNYSIKNNHSPDSSTTTPSAHQKPPSKPQQQQQQRSNSISPIDMNMQEMAKLERKRERNRHAATLCRNRKLERIARLEERVKELKDQNLTLAQTANLLRNQVSRLKQAIFEHTQMGCQVMLTSKFLDSDAMFS